MKKRNVLLLFLVVVMMALSFTACNKEEVKTEKAEAAEKVNEKKDKVTVSEFRFLKYAPVYLAKELGYYDEEGLDVDFIIYGDGPIAFQGMHAGDSDICLLSIDPVFRAFDEGLKSIVIGSVDDSRLYSLVGSKNIKSIKDLKGKSIFAGAPGSAPYSFVSTVLKENGIDPTKDVTFVQMDYGASKGALEKGTIDASFLDIMFKKDFERLGANFLVDSEDVNVRKKVFGSDKFESSIITVTKKFADENKEKIQKFVNGTEKGCKWFNDHSDEEVAQVIGSYFDVMGKEELLEKIGLVRIAASPDMKISKEGYDAMEKFCKNAGIMKEDIPYDEIIDMSYIDNFEKNNK